MTSSGLPVMRARLNTMRLMARMASRLWSARRAMYRCIAIPPYRPEGTWPATPLRKPSSQPGRRLCKGGGTLHHAARRGKPRRVGSWYTSTLHPPPAASGLPRPVHEPPQRPAERAEVEPADRVGRREHRVPDDDGDHHHVLHDEVVHPDEHGRALDRVHLALGGPPQPVVLVVAPAAHVDAGPLVGLLR